MHAWRVAIGSLCCTPIAGHTHEGQIPSASTEVYPQLFSDFAPRYGERPFGALPRCAARTKFFGLPQWTVDHDGEGVPKLQVFFGLNLQFPL